MIIIYLSHYKSKMNEGECNVIQNNKSLNNYIFAISEQKFAVRCTLKLF